MSSLIERGMNASWWTMIFPTRLYMPCTSAGSWGIAFSARAGKRTGFSRLLSAVVVLAGLVERDHDRCAVLLEAPEMPDLVALGSLMDEDATDPDALDLGSGEVVLCSHCSRNHYAPDSSCGPGPGRSSNSSFDCIARRVFAADGQDWCLLVGFGRPCCCTCRHIAALYT
jgi:hypothetical protein